MHIIVIIVLALLWLVTFWIGSIALEATGMQRSKARFQVLSAITGTGFTTSEAESVVNNTKRRKIVTWLILIGNTGIIAFIIGLILFVRVGVRAPTPLQIGIIVAVAVFIIAFIKLGFIDMITDFIISLFSSKKAKPSKTIEETIYKAGEYSVIRIEVGEGSKLAGNALKDTEFIKQEITILAIERGGVILSHSKLEEIIMKGDYLLCYGREANITEIV